MKKIRKQLEDLLHRMQTDNTPDYNLNEYCNHIKNILAQDWTAESDDDQGLDSSNPPGNPPPPPGH